MRNSEYLKKTIAMHRKLTNNRIMIKLAMFDLDGTVLDSLPDIHNCLMQVLDEYELPKQPISATRSHVGNGVGKLIERSLRDKDPSRYDEVYGRFNEIYRTASTKTTKPYDGFDEIFAYLGEGALFASIISNKAHEFTVSICERLGLSPLFSPIYGGDYFPEKKPNPMQLLAVMSHFAVKPEECIMIGDNYTDIEAGANAGIRTCFCSYGYGKLSHIQPSFTIDSPRELLTILKAG